MKAIHPTMSIIVPRVGQPDFESVDLSCRREDMSLSCILSRVAVAELSAWVSRVRSLVRYRSVAITLPELSFTSTTLSRMVTLSRVAVT
ncbi:MAG: hypothetical protein HXO18_06765 [Prevotella shahii]|uniref:hypothetical protein n=1 Tax=Hoylesella shahii TaxID=228603 RepID=UPI001CB0AF74|nr:hypothetical protein [Hoylesella shahii]MBF1568763.1 hypothetical protein [Hoylesella shahii]